MSTLTLRELNRATLARQMLLERAELAVPAGIERLVGLQAQQALAPFVGLWTRLRDFERDDLAGLIEDRTVVKATFLRGTLHLSTAADYRRFRTTLQPMLTAGWESIIKRRGDLPDLDPLIAATTELLRSQPRSFAEISRMLIDLRPDADVGSMRYGVRTHLPMVQAPTSARWSYPGNPKFALAQDWLDEPLSSEAEVGSLVTRYLAAFGPATAADVQTWSGLDVTDEVDKLKSDLEIFQDERGREILDLPDGPRPDADAPAPVRFLPEYDNLLLSHQKRTRVLADEHRSQVFLPGLRVRSTFLVDGFVAGAWKIDKAKGAATLMIEPFQSLTAGTRDALVDEGERLLRFVEDAAKSYDVRFAT